MQVFNTGLFEAVFYFLNSDFSPFGGVVFSGLVGWFFFFLKEFMSSSETDQLPEKNAT